MLRNNKGFTAIEMAVGIGLVVILTTIILSTQLMVTKDQTKLSQQLEESIDTNLAERIIFRDLNNVDPSYNNLTVKDDLGLDFFDFYPDLPLNGIPNKADRDVYLKLNGRTEFYVLVQDLSVGALMNYDPTAAYNIGPTPDDFNKSATLEFQSLNHRNWVSRQREYFWKDGRLLMLDTPARIRPVDAAGKVDKKIAPRSPVFIGSVQGANLVVDGVIKGLINTTHPETGEVIDNPDTFLKTVPSIGGGQSLVRLRAVRLVKYYLAKYDDARFKTPPAYLYKVTYENGKWSEPFMLADQVDELHLRRDSVVKRMIYFKLKKVERKDGKTARL